MMRLLRKFPALIGHDSIDGEFSRLELLNDADFEKARAGHLARRPMPANTDNVGAIFGLSLFAVPTCFILSLIKGDSVLLGSSLLWLSVGLVTFFYLASAGKYWREHYAFISEEIRRYGSPSFG